MKYKHLSLLILLVSVLTASTLAQSNWNLKLNLASLGINSKYFDIDKAPISFEPGLDISYEFFLKNRKLSGRINETFILQNGNDFSSYTSTTLHYSIYNKWKVAINIGAGVGMGFFVSSDQNNINIPYPILNIEYNRSINQKWDFSIQSGYNYYNSLNLSIGLRYWLSKEIRKRHGCLACPD